MYTTPTMQLVRRFSYTILQNYPVQVATLHDMDLLVVGGDDGFARIYNLRTGLYLQKLVHSTSKYFLI